MEVASYEELKHIPGGEGGLPILGNFIDFTTNTLNYYRSEQSIHGDVFKTVTPMGTGVIVCGPAVNKLLLVDHSKSTSNAGAWQSSLGRLFPNGLMLMDGDQHKSHRSIILEAFKPKPMQGYLDGLPELFQHEFDRLKGVSEFDALPFFKQLTLKIAAEIFFGFDIRSDLSKVNQAISDIVNASTALPINLPFTTFKKGLQGRAFLVDYFQSVLPERRSAPGRDLFSRLCEVENEEGEKLTDQEIIDHLIFILMAAHDTTAITMTWMSYLLAKHPKWQQRIHNESISVVGNPSLKVSDIRRLESSSLVFKETLRLNPPLILIPRYLTEELEINGLNIPKKTVVSAVIQLTQTDDRVWDNAAAFDPERFTNERKEQNRCPFSYAPFGAGNHHCIGFQFAEMSTKLGMSMLLNQFELTVPENYSPKLRAVPMKQPTDGLPIGLSMREKMTA